MTERDEQRNATPAPERVLFTDLDGEPTQVQELMDDGPEDYEDRIPALIELTERGQPAHRLYATMILAAWGNEHGFRRIVEWARNPERTPWASSPVTYDRFYGTDSSFASMADAVRTSLAGGSDPDVETTQIDAIRALLEVSNRRYVDRDLASAITRNRSINEQVAPDIRRAIEAAMAVLKSGERTGFDLGFQTASLLSALAGVDDVAAARYADQLMSGLGASERMLRELAAALGHGRGPATADALERLRTLSLPNVDREVEAAFARRERAVSSWGRPTEVRGGSTGRSGQDDDDGWRPG